MKTGIIFVVLLMAVNCKAAEYKTGQNIQLTGKFSDTLFAAGARVNADFESTDDVFIAAREITYSAKSSENLFMVGGHVVIKNASARMSTFAARSASVTNADFRDLIFAGGKIRLTDTRVTDDATLSGGNIVVDANTNIGGSLTINGGSVVFNGTASQDTVINGGDVLLAGQFLGNVRVNAERLQVGPGAVIQGNLSHTVQDLQISPAASIQGSTVALEQPTTQSPWMAVGIGAGVLLLLGSLLVPAVTATLFGRTVTEGRTEERMHFWSNLGKGLLTLILIPPILVLLFSSIIGLPLGMAAIPFLTVGAILAWSTSVFTVGDQLRMWLSRREKRDRDFELARSGRFWWTALGGLILTVVFAIPVVGFIFNFVLFVVGVGSLYAQFRTPQIEIRRSTSTRSKLEPPTFTETHSPL